MIKKILYILSISLLLMYPANAGTEGSEDLSKSGSIVMLLKKNHEIKKVLFKS